MLLRSGQLRPPSAPLAADFWTRSRPEDRAAEALQLAAALESSGSTPSGVFITYDERLRAAAEREGFTTP